MKQVSFSLFSLLGFLSQVAGCSLGMTTLPPGHMTKHEPVCSEFGRPLGDVVAAGLVGVSFFYASVATAAADCGDDPQGSCDDLNKGFLGVGIVGAAALLASSVYGFNNAQRCTTARQDYAAWRSKEGLPDTEARESEQSRELANRQRCDQWRAELSKATTSEEKLALARRRPNDC